MSWLVLGIILIVVGFLLRYFIHEAIVKTLGYILIVVGVILIVVWLVLLLVSGIGGLGLLVLPALI